MDDITEFRGEYRWLSNFYLVPVQLDNEIYPSVEHAYQAAKSLDNWERDRIRKVIKPGDAKYKGRFIPLRKDWDVIKDDIMLGLLRDKFSILEMKAKLIATGDSRLIEGNTWGDIYWGVCRGIGKNKLGELLMQVRGEIANGQR